MNNKNTKVAEILFSKKRFDANLCRKLFLDDNLVSSDIQHLFHLYLSKREDISQEFDLDFFFYCANEIPEEFVKAIRYNQTFLEVNRINSLKHVPLPENLKIHQKAWEMLQEKEIGIWTRIKKSFLLLKEIYPTEVFVDTIFWLEGKRFHNNDKLSLQTLSSTYSFFMELYLHEYKPKLKLSSDDFSKVFLDNISEEQGNKCSCYTSQVLDEVFKWINFNQTFLIPYCYDDSFVPFVENEKVTFRQLLSELNRWKKDGIRYEVNDLEYYLKSAELTEYLLEEGELKIPKGKSQKDTDLNYQLAIKDAKMHLLLDDSFVNNFRFGKTQTASYSLIKPLLAYSVNRYSRYELGLNEYRTTSQNWTETYCKLLINSIKSNVEILPYLYLAKQEYIELNSEALEIFPEELYTEIINIFSYNISKNEVKIGFDRFNRKYDVFLLPFIRMGEMLFSPMLFFANNDWFYTALQAGIKNLGFRFNSEERKKTSEEMEKSLGSIFELKGWNVKVISASESNKIDGDIDIFVSDNDTDLFIQLKRTKLRFSLKEAHNEKMTSDLKASQQLNDASKYLQKDNDIFRLNGTPVKWLVSTSYENIGVEMNRCTKVNYYDVINVLRIQSFDSLKNFIEYIETDKLFEKWKDMYNTPNLPLDIKMLIGDTGVLDV